MKRSSSEAVVETVWNEGQQEPANKKNKADDIVLEIELDEAVQEPTEQKTGEEELNGHQDAPSHEQNGHNGNASNGHSNGQEEHIGEQNGTNGHSDDMEPLVLETELNGAHSEDAAELQVEVEEIAVEQIVETEDVPDAKEQIVEVTSEEEELSQEAVEDITKPEESPEEEIKMEVVSQVAVKQPEEKAEEAPSKVEISAEKTWDRQSLNVTELAGHAFKVNAVDMSSSILVSASDDTTVKAWDIDSKKEICTLSGHKDAVTTVQILDLAMSKELLCEEEGNVVISGSKDCCVKLWHLPSGKELKSIYTFNAITCVRYIANEALLVTATEGGKLELFDAVTGTPLGSVLAFDQPVASLKVCGDMIVCCDPQCCVQVWVIKDRKLSCRRTSNGMETSKPRLSGIDFFGIDNLLAGFRTGSVKKMSWLNGSVKKLRNGSGDEVDALQVQHELLIVSTSKDENSFLNFYNLPTGMYLGSAPGTSKMSSLVAIRKDGLWNFATGGSKLQLWQATNQISQSENAVLISVLPQSEISPIDTSDSEDEDPQEPPKKESAGFSCSVM